MNILNVYQGVSHSSAITAAIWGSCTSFALCIFLVFTKSWHGVFTLDNTHGVQKFHTAPTPRVGGLGLIFGLAAAWNVSSENSEISALLGYMLVAGLPAFIFGMAEDLTKRVGVRERLLATMASGLLAWWLTGYSVTRVNILGLDPLLSWLPLSVVFTMVAVSGIANAINIIDGFNGLAGGALTISYLAISLISYQVNDLTMFQVSVVLASITAGFLLVNFPLGKIFLGDGGAYLMGFLLAWLAVMLPARNPSVSAWASLLVCGYPLLEVIFSIKRKHARVGHHPSQPDKVHLHMLMYRRVSRPLFHASSPALKNGLTSPMIWPFSALCGGLACLFYQQTALLIAAFCFVAICYHLTYSRLTQFAWVMGIKGRAK
jgi:UDP-N-acetylmuramyl pentapeptide phosphotransferase/UDP-N-acetylglucosamine-1-phosphate transferase